MAYLEKIEAAIEGTQKALVQLWKRKPRERRDGFLRTRKIMETRTLDRTQAIRKLIAVSEAFGTSLLGLEARD